MSLEILAREFGERSVLSVTTNLEPVDLDEAAQLTVYRLVQESLTNIADARAQQVHVSVQNYGSHVTVEVEDDQPGLRHQPHPSRRPATARPAAAPGRGSSGGRLLDRLHRLARADALAPRCRCARRHRAPRPECLRATRVVDLLRGQRTATTVRAAGR
ncbi:MAG: hypothetical protein QM777_22645 [Pseudorhodoferax sp.]